MARSAYKVEELLALRASASGSTVSLEKFPDEDVIKEPNMEGSPTPTLRHRCGPRVTFDQMVQRIAIAEQEKDDVFADNIRFPEHVLKASVSNPGLLTTAGENARPPPLTVNNGRRASTLPFRSNPFMSSTVKRPSPTPSVKRHKVEKMIKEHGSPPHIRVTAGGRIVPTDMTPLGSPRFSFTSLHRPVGTANFHLPRNVSNPVRSATSLPNGYVSYTQDGQLCQHVDGKWLPVPIALNGSLGFHMTSPNWPFPPIGVTPVPHLGMINGALAAAPICPPVMPPAQPQQVTTNTQPSDNINISWGEVDGQIQVLQAEYEKLRRHKIDFERQEVKMSEELTPQMRANIVEQKRRFVIDLDGIRRSIKDLETMKHPGNINSVTAYMQPSQLRVAPGDTRTMPPPFVSTTPATRDFEWPALPSHEEVSHQSPTSESSPISRVGPQKRSHAIEIKDPNTHRPTTDPSASSLNPTSPSYEPGKPFQLPEGSPPQFVVPAPSPIETPNLPPAQLAEQYPWVFETSHSDGSRIPGTNDAGKIESPSLPSSNSQGGTVLDEREHRERHSQHQTSLSSVTTTDFFPTNTHEHSFGKYMLRKTSGRLSGEHYPSTPQKTFRSSGLISPMSEQQIMRAPPVSPIGSVDFRMSSFLRDTAVGMALADGEFNTIVGGAWQSPIRPDIRAEFDGKSKLYLEGYIAATAQKAPADRSVEYTEGYCDGMRASMRRKSDTRSTSTISLKSEVSCKTPPNTATARSVGSTGPSHPNRHENVRLTQSTTHLLQPDRLSFGHQETFGTSGSAPDHSQATSSILPDEGKPLSYVNQQDSLLPLQRAISKAPVRHNSSRDTDIAETAIWNVRSIPIGLSNHGKAAMSGPVRHEIPAGRERIMSTSQPQQHKSQLSEYAGNRHTAAVRVLSAPQGMIFGDDKYNVRPTAELQSKADGEFHVTRVPREWSGQSQIDGAMDDMAEMATPAEEYSKAGASFTHTMFSTDPASPPASPPKSGSSPRKLSSPKARIQQLASHAREMIGSVSERIDHKERPRPESPDPKRMGPEEKRRWKAGWREKFDGLKRQETAEIKKYKKDNPF